MQRRLLWCFALRWIVHGNITPAAVEALVRHGHAAQIDALPPDSETLLEFAGQRQLDVLTTDRDVGQQLLDRKEKFSRSIVHLQLGGGPVEQDDAIDRLFARFKRLKPGMLYTVTETRVKARQLPGS